MPTVDSTLATVEVSLQLEACTLSDAAATTATDATQALRTDHAHARALVAQDTQAFRNARTKMQHAEKAADRRAAWGCWDAHYRRFPETMRALLVEERIADDERDHRWAAEQDQWAAEQAEWDAQRERWAVELARDKAEFAALRAEFFALVDDVRRQAAALNRCLEAATQLYSRTL
ncbi:hypothetical protein HYPSUDRAFT_46883 [Hypholoma sublateritium FD-334 SS-4]|uniref:Uncharacterized protein n=1 Tax=Hypholoma sublateritium (strain FD-334 SS-4) TaxID=945553 RepID=A0A0D2KQR0_HYPSF|nr:hypothetical protein HYPSUDRAFT_46883 [Hypholoma sublateritium FD-334 SS-4]